MRNKSSGEKLSIAPRFFCVSYDALFLSFVFQTHALPTLPFHCFFR